MNSVSWWKRVTVFVTLLVHSILSTATPTALSVTPSTNWYGDDGTWSAVEIRVGTPEQWTYLLVSTASAETWVVGPDGCDATALCEANRGGLFNYSQSSTWKSEGYYDLGLDTQLNFTGYGYYGFDDLTFGTTGVTLPNAIIAQINTTEYWNGFFGLGIVPGSFSSFTATSPISGLVEKVGAIPSHSYGFTAGASYQLKGEPCSLTLGGYDANRFVPHDISFDLDPSQQPQAFLNGISVVSSENTSAWSTPVQLLYTTDRVYATIDSSTPYLWLPPSVCDRFAEALGLTYNTTLELYTFESNSSQHTLLENSSLTFTVSLSDVSTSTEIVNITLPYAAFDLQLSFPAIPNTTYGSTASTKYYFPLRQASDETEYTIGRAFLQEAYIITDYERNNFSVYQAVHTEDPIGNTSIVDITRPANSTFSGPPTGDSISLMPRTIAGIAVGATAFVGFLAFIVFYFCFRRKQKDAADNKSPLEAPPRTFMDHLRRRTRDPVPHETIGCTIYPIEMASDFSHERYELPAPLGPVELHSEASQSESNTLSGTTEASSDLQNLSAYERARRKHERQRVNMVALLGPSTPSDTNPSEKDEQDVSPVAHYRAPDIPDIPSPLSSPIDTSGGSLSLNGQPSPVSPAFREVPTSPTSTLPPHTMSPPPTYQRLSPANVVYAGRIPPNIPLPRHIPHMLGQDGQTLDTTDTGHGTSSTLGSHYTENQNDAYEDICNEVETDNGQHTVPNEIEVQEPPIVPNSGPNWPHDEETGTKIIGGRVVREEDEMKFRCEDIQSLRANIQTREITDPYRNGRRIDGEDLVHVPQPAANRFSWESGRSDRRTDQGEVENTTMI